MGFGRSPFEKPEAILVRNRKRLLSHSPRSNEIQATFLFAFKEQTSNAWQNDRAGMRCSSTLPHPGAHSVPCVHTLFQVYVPRHEPYPIISFFLAPSPNSSVSLSLWCILISFQAKREPPRRPCHRKQASH